MSVDSNECIKICDAGVIPLEASSHVFGAYTKYVAQLNNNPKNIVWYDKESDVCFGADQDFFANPAEFSFFHQKNTFMTHEPWGKYHLQNVLGQHLGMDVAGNEEAMFQRHPEFEKYKDSTILIVGAGPSAVDVEWQDTERDFTWTCTHFFKSDMLKKMNFDLITIGGNVSLEDPDLLSYMDENENTICVFEGGVSPFKTGQELQNFSRKYPNRTSYFHTRYFSKLGATARQVCFASFLGAKEIKFIGFDGNPVGQKHLFEGSEKVHDESWRNQAAIGLYRRQFILFWEYLLNFDDAPKYVNLGHGHPNNMTTDIMQHYIPLNLEEN